MPIWAIIALLVAIVAGLIWAALRFAAAGDAIDWKNAPGSWERRDHTLSSEVDSISPSEPGQ